MTVKTRRRLRRVGLELAVRGVQLGALVLTVVTFTYLNGKGFTPGDGNTAVAQSWMPPDVSTTLYEANAVYAAPWVCVIGSLMLWVCFFMARRELRCEFPREVY
jgi:hypothetical protein